MERVDWTADFSIGVAHIDEEHKVFFAMLNDLAQAIAGGQGQKATAKAVASMREYAQKHFRTEEDAMQATRYGGRTGHVAEHDTFIEKVLDLEDALAQGQAVHSAEVWEFLRGWLSRHILEHDKRLGQHLCANGMS